MFQFPKKRTTAIIYDSHILQPRFQIKESITNGVCTKAHDTEKTVANLFYIYQMCNISKARVEETNTPRYSRQRYRRNSMATSIVSSQLYLNIQRKTNTPPNMDTFSFLQTLEHTLVFEVLKKTKSPLDSIFLGNVFSIRDYLKKPCQFEFQSMPVAVQYIHVDRQFT